MSSTEITKQHPTAIYCFPHQEPSGDVDSATSSEPEDDSQTKSKQKAIKFEYCGDNCCKDKELASKGYKCLVNYFGLLGYYQAASWEGFKTEDLVNINFNKMKRGNLLPAKNTFFMLLGPETFDNAERFG